jgi:copper oxidase (laccase) domain-containing protein
MFRNNTPSFYYNLARNFYLGLKTWTEQNRSPVLPLSSSLLTSSVSRSFSSSPDTHKKYSSTGTPPRSRWGLGLALALGTVATSLAVLNEESRKKWTADIQKFHRALTKKQTSTAILEIPGLPQNQGAIHGVSTRELGNFGFITLTDGVKAEDLVADISKGIDQVALFSRKKSKTPSNKKPLLILNETAYASTKAPGLLKDSEGKPEFILSLTEKNIEEFIAQHRFSETGDFAPLRNKCIRVTGDGFVSNIGESADYQLYFAVNTADAAPVVLVDHKTGVIGILACSWHNIAKAELDELIQKMVKLGASPSQISMGIGPGLGPQSFEFNTSDTPPFYQPGIVDKRDGRPFQGRPSLKKYFVPHPKDPQKSLLNIPGMLTEIALENGIKPDHIHFDPSWDSMTHTQFFSARRSTPPQSREAESAKKYPKTARGISFIHSHFGKTTASLPRQSYYEDPIQKFGI